VAGILGGFIGKFLGEKGLAFLSGVALGVSLAFIFEGFIKEKLEGKSDYYYIVVVMLGLVLGSIALILKHWLIIISTSFVGSSFATFGVIIAIHPVIMKVDLSEKMFDKDDMSDSMQWNLILLIGTIVLGIIGIFYQRKYKVRREILEDELYDVN
jgi:hypothetical protein